MRRARIATALLTFVVVLLATAPAALADGVSHGGEGWYGETTDTVITNAMFMVIIFFPTVILIMCADRVASRQAQARADGRRQGPRQERRLARRLVAARPAERLQSRPRAARRSDPCTIAL